MARSGKEVYDEMVEMVDSKSVYRFESLDDEDRFEPFEGIPMSVTSEMFVRVTKDNGTLKKGDSVGIDPTEFCFMNIKKVK